jgi:hypothetical protein
LATGYDKLGKRDDARRTIDEIDSDAIDDPVIDIEKSFLDTGKPPPSSPPPTDELQRCLWMLDKHMGQIVAAARRRDRLLDDLLRTPNGHELNTARFAKLRDSFAASARAINAQAGASANLNPDVERARFNGALMICMNEYSQFTELDIEDVLNETEHVFFWSNVLAMSPEAYVDDTIHNFTPLDRRIMGGPLTSISDVKEHNDELIAVDRQYFAKNAELGCKPWQALHDRLAEAEGARYDDVAKHGFDAAATQLTRAIEAELADARGFIARELKQFRPPVQSLPKIATEAFNRVQAAEIGKLGQFLHARADDFLREQQALRSFLETEQNNINALCDKILNPPKINQLAQDDWQKVLAHFSSDFDSETDCDLEIDGAKVEWSDKEVKKLSLKFRDIKYKLDLNKREITVSRTWKWTVPESSSAPGADDDLEIGIVPSVIEKEGSLVGVGIDAQLEEGPFTAKGGVTLISDTNPKTGVKEPAVGFSTTAGIGFHGELGGIKGKVDCFPGKGTAKVYPRGLLQDAINYLVAASH